jgi:UDP-3-O-[3-hydroxymyristoyl] glucosamine N-acyltransferase
VTIGDAVVIEEFASIKENTVIGDGSVIRSGVVIGSEGFEIKKYRIEEGETVFTVKHLGGVIVGKNVEIMNNSSIEKAIYPWDDTVISDGCRFDNLVLIGHASRMGKRVFIAGESVIAGNVTIGDDVWIGVGATVSNRIVIGNNARVSLGAVVTRDVPENTTVSGNFAVEHSKFIEHLKKSFQV